MQRRVVRSLALIAIGSACGLVWNSVSPTGMSASHNVLIADGDEIIDAAQAKTQLDQGALFLDARPIAFYEMEHIPAALPLPEDDYDTAFARLEDKLRTSLSIVVYCSGYGCEASHNVARKLKSSGIPAAILHDGWPAWLDAGYPTRNGSEP